MKNKISYRVTHSMKQKLNNICSYSSNIRNTIDFLDVSEIAILCNNSTKNRDEKLCFNKTFYATDSQVEKLNKLSSALGFTVSEIVRILIENYVVNGKINKLKTEKFLSNYNL